MKKVILPRHEALWTALVAIDLNPEYPTSFLALLNKAKSDFENSNHNLMPKYFDQSKTMVADHKIKPSPIQKAYGSVTSAFNSTPVRIGAEIIKNKNAQNLIQNSLGLGISRIHGKYADILVNKLYNPDFFNHVDQYIISRPTLDQQIAASRPSGQDYSIPTFYDIFKIWKDIYQAYSYAKGTMSFYDLQPNNNEHDPDSCTCKPLKNGLKSPCNTIAKMIINRREGAMAESALKIALYPVPIVGSIAALAFENAIKNCDKPGEKYFYDDYSNLNAASHLWNAAQTYGRKLRINEKKLSQQIWDAAYGIIPGIFVDPVHRGCPKAISIIAALFGEFQEKSNYLHTLVSISTREGIPVINKNLNKVLGKAEVPTYQRYMLARQ